MECVQSIAAFTQGMRKGIVQAAIIRFQQFI